VKAINEFEFLPKALDAIKVFSQLFKYIIIVTNQQGIGKEIMTADELHKVHDKMTKDIIASGGYIDQIYFCPHLAIEDPMCRKPNPGMAFQAAAYLGTDVPHGLINASMASLNEVAMYLVSS